MSKKKKANPGNLNNSKKLTFFVNKITTTWNKQVESILDTGRLLIQAKKELEHGQFTKMIEEQLPFGERTAQRLMTIAEHPVLSNPTHVWVLPSSWGTLYQIAANIPEERLEELLKDGTIKADTEREKLEKIIEKIGEESKTDYSQLRQAIGVLVKLMKKHPERADENKLANAIVDHDDGDDEYPFSLDDMKQVGPWIEKLHAACLKEIEQWEDPKIEAKHPEEEEAVLKTRSLWDYKPAEAEEAVGASGKEGEPSRKRTTRKPGKDTATSRY